MISKKRIRKFSSNCGILKEGDSFIVGISIQHLSLDKLRKIGFSEKLEIGESVLPTSDLGPINKFNSEGKYIKHKNMPMETAYRTIQWTWKQWNGPHDRIEKTKFVDVPYKRYPRTFITPPSIEMKISKDNNGNKLIVSPLLKYNKEKDKNLVHVVNLFLEIFGHCNFFTKNLEEIIKTPIKNLNWNILPTGIYPWKILKKKLEKVIKSAPKGNRSVIEYRLSTINSYKPNFIAHGHAGFSGYIIFGFENLDYYILEKSKYGNATYIFDEKWRNLSKMTKAEILNNDLHKDRLIHHENWKQKIANLFIKK